LQKHDILLTHILKNKTKQNKTPYHVVGSKIYV
jgi:hypothetical protein